MRVALALVMASLTGCCSLSESWGSGNPIGWLDGQTHAAQPDDGPLFINGSDSSATVLIACERLPASQQAVMVCEPNEGETQEERSVEVEYGVRVYSVTVRRGQRLTIRNVGPMGTLRWKVIGIEVIGN